MPVDQGVLSEIGKGGAGADCDGGVALLDEAKLAKVLEAEKRALGEAASVEGHHQLGAACDGGMASRIRGEEIERRLEISWREDGIRCRIGAHL